MVDSPHFVMFVCFELLFMSRLERGKQQAFGFIRQPRWKRLLRQTCPTLFSTRARRIVQRKYASFRALSNLGAWRHGFALKVSTLIEP